MRRPDTCQVLLIIKFPILIIIRRRYTMQKKSLIKTVQKNQFIKNGGFG
jgi:hypothetical protein